MCCAQGRSTSGRDFPQLPRARGRPSVHFLRQRRVEAAAASLQGEVPVLQHEWDVSAQLVVHRQLSCLLIIHLFGGVLESSTVTL